MDPLRLRRILIYSQDKTLLYTRRRVLERDGWTVDIASSAKIFQDYVATRLDNCSLIILCDTIPAPEQQSIESAAQHWKVKVHTMTMMTEPAALADQVVHLMDN